MTNAMPPRGKSESEDKTVTMTVEYWNLIARHAKNHRGISVSEMLRRMVDDWDLNHPLPSAVATSAP
jgi:hypothetical protein